MRTEILDKLPDESRVYAFDFSLQPEFVDGQTLITPAVTAEPAGLTIDTPTVDGAFVKAEFSSGVPGQTYMVKCDVTTSAGAILGGFGRLRVLEAPTV